MIQFDFASPYLIYVIYVGLTAFSVFALFKWPTAFKRHEKALFIVALIALIYAQYVRYAIPYFEGRPTYPFYISRLASIATIGYLVVRKPAWDGFVFFIAVNNIWPVLVPAGPIETIRIHDESFFIDHYVTSLLAIYILTARHYVPRLKDLFWASSVLGVIIIGFVYINPLMGWGYFFMNRHNALLSVWPTMPWLIFAVLLTLGVFTFQLIMYAVGKTYHKKRA